MQRNGANLEKDGTKQRRKEKLDRIILLFDIIIDPKINAQDLNAKLKIGAFFAFSLCFVKCSRIMSLKQICVHGIVVSG